MFAEIKRLIGNLIVIGTITQTKVFEGKALARIKVGDRETDFLPVISLTNSFKRHFIPVRANEQAVLFSPFGDASSGFIIRSLFNIGSKEPNGANEHTEVIEYEDGTVISYDTKAKILEIDCVKDISIKAKNISIEAENTKFVGGSITHDGIPIDKTHTHTQNDGNDNGGGAITTPPNG